MTTSTIDWVELPATPNILPAPGAELATQPTLVSPNVDAQPTLTAEAFSEEQRIGIVRRGLAAAKRLLARELKDAAPDLNTQLALGVAVVGAVAGAIHIKNPFKSEDGGRMDGQPRGSAPLEARHMDPSIARQVEALKRSDETRHLLSKTSKELRRIRDQEDRAAERALVERNAARDRGDSRTFWYYEDEAHRHYRIRDAAEDIVTEIRGEKW